VRNYSPQEEHEERQAYALPHFQHKHKQQPQQPHRNNQKRPWNRKDVGGTQGGVKFRRINVSNNSSSRDNAVQPAPAEHHPRAKRVSKLIILADDGDSSFLRHQRRILGGDYWQEGKRPSNMPSSMSTKVPSSMLTKVQSSMLTKVPSSLPSSLLTIAQR
jgi:hypothetical protein